MTPAWALAASLVGCGTDPPPPDTCPDDSWVTWSNFAEPLTITWCTGCHSSNVAGEHREGAPPGVDLDTAAGVAAYADRVAVRIAPGASAPMPPFGGPSDAERELYLEWLTCGMPGAPPPEVDPCAVRVAHEGDLRLDGSAGGPACPSFNAVTGDLIAEADATELDCLCAVDGDLVIGGAAARVTLPSLATVGGDLVIRDAEELVEVSLPALHTLGGRLDLGGTSPLEELALPALLSSGEVLADGLSNLRVLDLPLLVTVSGPLTVRDHPRLEVLVLSRVSEIAGGFTLAGNLELVEWRGQEAPRSLDGDIEIADNDALTSLAPFGRLLLVPGDVHVADNRSLRTFSGFQTAEVVSGTVIIERNDSLWRVETLPNVLTISGGFVLRDNPQLSELSGPLFVQSIGVGLAGGPGLELARSPALTLIPPFDRLTALDQLLITGTGLQQLEGFDALASLPGDLRLELNPGLLQVGAFDVLPAIGGSLAILDAPTRELGGFPALTEVGELRLARLALESLDGLTALDWVGGDLAVEANPALAEVQGLHGVTQVGGTLRVADNPLLTQAAVDALIDAIGAANIGSLDATGG